MSYLELVTECEHGWETFHNTCQQSPCPHRATHHGCPGGFRRRVEPDYEAGRTKAEEYAPDSWEPRFITAMVWAIVDAALGLGESDQ